MATRKPKGLRKAQTLPILTAQDEVLEYMRSMTEVDLHTQIVYPLLKRRGFQGIQYVHGSQEKGKDFIYVYRDHNGLNRLEVCQVKNAPFTGRASSSESVASVINQLRVCSSTQSLDPTTQKKVYPYSVILYTTYPIEDRHAADMKQELDDLDRQRITIFPPHDFADLVLKHLPHIRRKLGSPTATLAKELFKILNVHNEYAAFESDSSRTLDSFYVSLTLGPTNRYLQEWSRGGLHFEDRRNGQYTPIEKPQFDSLINIQRAMPEPLRSVRVLYANTHGDDLSTIPPGPDRFLEYAETSEITVGHVDLLSMLARFDSYVTQLRTGLTAPNSRESLDDVLYVVDGMGDFLSRLAKVFQSNLFPVHSMKEQTVQKAAKRKTLVAKAESSLAFACDPAAFLKLTDDVCILGDAGAGKTSLVRAIARAGLKEGMLVVYFPCLRLRDEQATLGNELSRYLKEVDPEATPADVANYIKNADLLILDGCDEAATFGRILEEQIFELAGKPNSIVTRSDYPQVPLDLEGLVETDIYEHRLRINEALRLFDEKRLEDINVGAAFLKRLARSFADLRRKRPRIITTTRAEADLELPKSFRRLRLEPMSDMQLQEFFEKWFNGSPGKANELGQFLLQNTRIREVCRTPMVATILAALAENGYDLPKTRTEVFARRFELLLHRWGAVKDVPKRQCIPVADKKHFLAALAYFLHSHHERHFTFSQVRELWRRRYSQSFNAVDFDELLDELVIFNGVIYHEGSKRYSLGHLSFQEYLCALHVVNKQKLKSLVEHVGEAWWREVMIFYAGITQDAAPLIGGLMRLQGIPEDKDFLNELRQEARLTSVSAMDFMNEVIVEDEAPDFSPIPQRSNCADEEE